jgi:hypothetical protein
MKNIYPSLLESGNIITSNSWFDIKEHKNESYNKKRKEKNIIVDYIDTIKIFTDVVDNFNAPSAIGTLDFLDSISKYNTIDNVCMIRL